MLNRIYIAYKTVFFNYLPYTAVKFHLIGLKRCRQNNLEDVKTELVEKSSQLTKNIPQLTRRVSRTGLTKFRHDSIQRERPSQSKDRSNGTVRKKKKVLFYLYLISNWEPIIMEVEDTRRDVRVWAICSKRQIWKKRKHFAQFLWGPSVLNENLNPIYFGLVWF